MELTTKFLCVRPTLNCPFSLRIVVFFATLSKSSTNTIENSRLWSNFRFFSSESDRRVMHGSSAKIRMNRENLMNQPDRGFYCFSLSRVELHLDASVVFALLFI